MNTQHILVVDDDQAMIKLLRANLQARGYPVLVAQDGAEALRVIEKNSPDLVILDIMMPKIDGLEVCKRIREWSKIPILILTALGDIGNKVNCFDIGADDYITKPFAIDELMARVRAVLRRSKTAGKQPTPSTFTNGALRVEFASRLVTVAGSEIKLSPTEYKLLRELILNADRVLTHTHLLNTVWGLEYRGEREYLREYISHLRAKIESEPKNPCYIITVPGVGYQFKKSK